MAARGSGMIFHELVTTEAGFLDAVAGLSEAQARFKPAGDVWSVLEITEHVTRAEHGAFRMLQRMVAGAPASPEERAATKGKDMKVTAVLFDRSTRRDAPEGVRPTGRWGTLAEAAEAFQVTRQDVLRWLESQQQDLRGWTGAHPVLGQLDGKQWLLFMVAHCERHSRQILELKGREDFPLG